MEHEAEYSGMRNMIEENSVHDLKSRLTEPELENGLVVRKSQRIQKKKVIKSKKEKEGIIVNKKNTQKRRIKLSNIKKGLPEKKKIIQSQRQQMINHKTPTKSQDIQQSENSTNNHITSKQSHNMNSKDSFRINKVAEKMPNHKIRYDEIAHFPGVDVEKRRRCKFEGCIHLTYIYCEKCNVHLCINMRRNCFKEFHIVTIDTN